ncbi:hypothetical protein [Lysinibacillus pakistanensis]|uniref:DUF3139 domain-containing protein n=1 Tax=Lysinibacillus pakistanensis TaxID=759811 RepID=A0ABX6DAH9_9BACI|nr:hypothetical protein GDS87_07990 [Lysinibacillus pakistanensis]
MGIKAIELFFVIGIYFFLFVISFFLRKKGKKILYSFIIIILISYAVFLTVRPNIQDAKYDKYTQMVEEHLEKKYPNASWETSFDKEELLTTAFGYQIKVKFADERTVLYVYKIENDKVIQAYVSYNENHLQNDGKYVERD